MAEVEEIKSSVMVLDDEKIARLQEDPILPPDSGQVNDFSHSLIFQPLPCRSADPCKLHRIQESRYCKGERGENGVHVHGTELDKKWTLGCVKSPCVGKGERRRDSRTPVHYIQPREMESS